MRVPLAVVRCCITVLLLHVVESTTPPFNVTGCAIPVSENGTERGVIVAIGSQCDVSLPLFAGTNQSTFEAFPSVSDARLSFRLMLLTKSGHDAAISFCHPDSHRPLPFSLLGTYPPSNIMDTVVASVDLLSLPMRAGVESDGATSHSYITATFAICGVIPALPLTTFTLLFVSSTANGTRFSYEWPFHIAPVTGSGSGDARWSGFRAAKVSLISSKGLVERPPIALQRGTWFPHRGFTMKVTFVDEWGNDLRRTECLTSCARSDTSPSATVSIWSVELESQNCPGSQPRPLGRGHFDASSCGHDGKLVAIFYPMDLFIPLEEGTVHSASAGTTIWSIKVETLSYATVVPLLFVWHSQAGLTSSSEWMQSEAHMVALREVDTVSEWGTRLLEQSMISRAPERLALSDVGDASRDDVRMKKLAIKSMTVSLTTAPETCIALVTVAVSIDSVLTGASGVLNGSISCWLAWAWRDDTMTPDADVRLVRHGRIGDSQTLSIVWCPPPLTHAGTHANVRWRGLLHCSQPSEHASHPALAAFHAWNATTEVPSRAAAAARSVEEWLMSATSTYDDSCQDLSLLAGQDSSNTSAIIPLLSLTSTSVTSLARIVSWFPTSTGSVSPLVALEFTDPPATVAASSWGNVSLVSIAATPSLAVTSRWLMVPNPRFLDVPVGYLASFSFGGSYCNVGHVSLTLSKPLCVKNNISAADQDALGMWWEIAVLALLRNLAGNVTVTTVQSTSSPINSLDPTIYNCKGLASDSLDVDYWGLTCELYEIPTDGISTTDVDVSSPKWIQDGPSGGAITVAVVSSMFAACCSGGTLWYIIHTLKQFQSQVKLASRTQLPLAVKWRIVLAHMLGPFVIIAHAYTIYNLRKLGLGKVLFVLDLCVAAVFYVCVMIRLLMPSKKHTTPIYVGGGVVLVLYSVLLLSFALIWSLAALSVDVRMIPYATASVLMILQVVWQVKWCGEQLMPSITVLNRSFPPTTDVVRTTAPLNGALSLELFCIMELMFMFAVTQVEDITAFMAVMSSFVMGAYSFIANYSPSRQLSAMAQQLLGRKGDDTDNNSVELHSSFHSSSAPSASNRPAHADGGGDELLRRLLDNVQESPTLLQGITRLTSHLQRSRSDTAITRAEEPQIVHVVANSGPSETSTKHDDAHHQISTVGTNPQSGHTNGGSRPRLSFESSDDEETRAT